MSAPSSLLSAVVDEDLYFSGRGKFRRTGGKDKDCGEVVYERLDSSLNNYHIYCYPSFRNPSLCNSPPLVPCTHVPVPPTLNTLAIQFFPVPQLLDAHAPAFFPVPDPPTLFDQAPVFSPGTDISSSFSHIAVPVIYPWVSTPDPPDLATIYYSTPGPAPSAPNNPSPAAAPTALAPPGPTQ